MVKDRGARVDEAELSSTTVLSGEMATVLRAGTTPGTTKAARANSKVSKPSLSLHRSGVRSRRTATCTQAGRCLVLLLV